MKDLISVSVLRNDNQLSCAAVLRKENGSNSVLGLSRLVWDSTHALHEAVRQLLIAVKVRCDIMIKAVVSHHSDGSAEDSEILAEAIRRTDTEVTPVSQNTEDAAVLALWWADQD